MPVKLLAIAILAALSLGWALPTQAEEFDYSRETQRTSPAKPMCYKGLNGEGKTIPWVKTKLQCLHQSNGQSWGHSGQYENIYRDSPRDRW